MINYEVASIVMGISTVLCIVAIFIFIFADEKEWRPSSLLGSRSKAYKAYIVSTTENYVDLVKDGPFSEHRSPESFAPWWAKYLDHSLEFIAISVSYAFIPLIIGGAVCGALAWRVSSPKAISRELTPNGLRNSSSFQTELDNTKQISLLPASDMINFRKASIIAILSAGLCVVPGIINWILMYLSKLTGRRSKAYKDYMRSIYARFCIDRLRIHPVGPEIFAWWWVKCLVFDPNIGVLFFCAALMLICEGAICGVLSWIV